MDDNDYVGGEGSLNRNTTLYYGGLGGNYKLTEYFGVRAEYARQERDSPLAADNYDENRVSLTVKYMY